MDKKVSKARGLVEFEAAGQTHVMRNRDGIKLRAVSAPPGEPGAMSTSARHKHTTQLVLPPTCADCSDATSSFRCPSPVPRCHPPRLFPRIPSSPCTRFCLHSFSALSLTNAPASSRRKTSLPTAQMRPPHIPSTTALTERRVQAYEQGSPSCSWAASTRPLSSLSAVGSVVSEDLLLGHAENPDPLHCVAHTGSLCVQCAVLRCWPGRVCLYLALAVGPAREPGTSACAVPSEDQEVMS